MIPMSVLLLAWFVLVFVFVVFALLTLTVYVRFGLSSAFTTVSAGAFLAVSIVVIAVAGLYLLQVDWSRNLGSLRLTPFGSQDNVSEFQL